MAETWSICSLSCRKSQLNKWLFALWVNSSLVTANPFFLISETLLPLDAAAAVLSGRNRLCWVLNTWKLLISSKTLAFTNRKVMFSIITIWGKSEMAIECRIASAGFVWYYRSFENNNEDTCVKAFSTLGFQKVFKP